MFFYVHIPTFTGKQKKHVNLSILAYLPIYKEKRTCGYRIYPTYTKRYVHSFAYDVLYIFTLSSSPYIIFIFVLMCVLRKRRNKKGFNNAKYVLIVYIIYLLCKEKLYPPTSIYMLFIFTLTKPTIILCTYIEYNNYIYIYIHTIQHLCSWKGCTETYTTQCLYTVDVWIRIGFVLRRSLLPCYDLLDIIFSFLFIFRWFIHAVKAIQAFIGAKLVTSLERFAAEMQHYK